MSRRAYPEYKQSGVEWLGEIPEHWMTVRAKYCSKVNMGQSPNSEDCNVDGNGLPFLQGNAEFGSENPTPRQYCDVARKIASKGDLLISVRAPVGALNVADQDYGIGRGLCGITPNAAHLNLRFSWYLLHQIRTELNFQATGSTYDAVSANDVESITCVLPYVQEQISIAAFLDWETARIDTLIEKKQRQIELLQEKRAALISHAVTKGLDPKANTKNSGIEWLGEIPKHWTTCPIKRVSIRIQTGCTPPTAEERYYEDGTVPWYGPGSFGKNIILSEPVKLLNEAAIREGAARLFAADSILVVCIGATIGKVGYLAGPASSNQQITAITPNPKKASGKFLAYQLKRLEHVLRGIAPSTTLPIMDQQEVGYLPCALPTLDEQNLIIDHLDRLLQKADAMTGMIHESLAIVREYRTALISAAVTGKIDVRKEVA